MFFTIGPKHLKQPLVAHCEWDEGRTESGGSPNLRLLVCSSQEQLQSLLEGNGLSHLDQLQQPEVTEGLPATSDTQLVEIIGDAGGSLGGMLTAMANDGAHIEAFAAPELGGFWGPQPSGPRGEGILIWADEEGAFHLAICRSKSQAATVLRNFAWMDGARRESLLNKVSAWNCRPDSNVDAQRIDGIVAELFYHASIWGKVKSAQRRAMH